ncbi:hypothetical protein MASR2M29_18760 [Spirochaetota bacterium]
MNIETPRPKALFFVLLAAFILLPALACTGGKAPKAAAKPQKGLKEAVLSCKDVKITVELAVSENEQMTGLMHRAELPDGRGMLFVYDSDRQMSFWMKNTLIPLSIAYIGADGTIKEIYDMEPLSLDAVSSQRHVRYALEVPKAWFKNNGILPGDKFNIPEALGLHISR